MDILQLLDKNRIAVRLVDKVQDVEKLMSQLLVSSLAVLDKNKFIGFILRDHLRGKDGLLTIEQLKESIYPSAFIDFHTHWYDVLKEMRKHRICTLAVLENEQYRGVITAKSMLQTLGNNTSVKMPGTIIVLEISVYDYMLSRIAQITEERNVKIMNLNVEGAEDSPFLKVHLKLNTLEVEGITREFERYGFHVLETYHNNSAFQEDIMDNYDALMKYLDV